MSSTSTPTPTREAWPAPALDRDRLGVAAVVLFREATAQAPR